jgi:alpha-N-arabinofuranosidase
VVVEKTGQGEVPVPKVVVRADVLGHPMSENIYSQFIEHLGRCIYGGIWAEMLEDRKFYHPVTETYRPYTRLLDSAYPVVGASPLERLGLAAHVRQIPDNIRRKAEFLKQAQGGISGLKEKGIRIAMTEWNYWYGPHAFGELGTRYFLKDGLGIAAGLHEFARQSEFIESAFYAQTVNVIGAIKVSRRNAAFETTGLVLKMYRDHFGLQPVETAVEGLVDVQAAWNGDRSRLTLGVVNPGMSEVVLPLEVEGAALTGAGWWWRIAGGDPQAFNDPDGEMKVGIEEGGVEGVGAGLRLAPCSATVFELEVQP